MPGPFKELGDSCRCHALGDQLGSLLGSLTKRQDVLDMASIAPVAWRFPGRKVRRVVPEASPASLVTAGYSARSVAASCVGPVEQVENLGHGGVSHFGAPA